MENKIKENLGIEKLNKEVEFFYQEKGLDEDRASNIDTSTIINEGRVCLHIWNVDNIISTKIDEDCFVEVKNALQLAQSLNVLDLENMIKSTNLFVRAYATASYMPEHTDEIFGYQAESWSIPSAEDVRKFYEFYLEMYPDSRSEIGKEPIIKKRA